MDRTRADVEAELIRVRRAFEAAPDVAETRFAYAHTLYELGDVWEAMEIIAPLATVSTCSSWGLGPSISIR